MRAWPLRKSEQRYAEIVGCCKVSRSTMKPPSSIPFSLTGRVGFAPVGVTFDLRCRRIPKRLTGIGPAVFAAKPLVGRARRLLGSLAAGVPASAASVVMFFLGGPGGGVS